jgi:hypothetical protein
MLALGACDHAFGISTVGPPGIDAAPPGVDADLRSATGCADGTREGFRDLVAYPDIAACAGAWNEGGLMAPPMGNGCTPSVVQRCAAADLCATGWAICVNHTDMATHGAVACDASADAGFYATLQRSHSAGMCIDDLAYDNDLFGCDAPVVRDPSVLNCAPIDATSGDLCNALTAAWVCADGSHELSTVLKTAASDGGILCCRQ